MSKPMVEAGLAVTGALVGATGAALIEPLVIGAAVLIAGVAVYMRVSDQRLAESEKLHEMSAVD